MDLNPCYIWHFVSTGQSNFDDSTFDANLQRTNVVPPNAIITGKLWARPVDSSIADPTEITSSAVFPPSVSYFSFV
jgi:hypothetical protein